MQIHFGATRIYEDLAGVVIQIKRKVQSFLRNLYPLSVLALLFQLPGGALIVVALNLLEG